MDTLSRPLNYKMEQLLDFSQPFDVSLLDQVVAAAYDPRNPQVHESGNLCLRKVNFVIVYGSTVHHSLVFDGP